MLYAGAQYVQGKRGVGYQVIELWLLGTTLAISLGHFLGLRPVEEQRSERRSSVTLHMNSDIVITLANKKQH